MSERLFFEHADCFEDFESFVSELLNTGVVLPGLANPSGLAGGSCGAVAQYGKKGDNQRGVDLVGLLPDGNQIVFQCKYRTKEANRRFGKTEASSAIRLAQEKYPEAVQYVLVTNHEFTTGASDVLNRAGWWSWTSETLLALVQTLSREQGYHLIHKYFGPARATKMFPDGPNILLTPREYRESFLNSPLAHDHECLGRDMEIETLKKTLTATKPRAVLLLGEGGVGKSRLFCEVLERLVVEDVPGTLVRVVQAGLSEASATQIFRKDGKRIILGIDDCHLPGYFREDIVIALRQACEDARLFLVTRPEAAPGLRDQLRRLGWAIDEREMHLSALGREAMYQLAKDVVGRDGQDVRHLARLSDGNALVTMVGGRLLAKEKITLRRAIHSEEFKAQVYQSLEDGFLRNIDRQRSSLAKKILRVLAAISPWQRKTEEGLAEFLSLEKASFDQLRSDLWDAGLIRDQGDSCRVIPDLLADHLTFDFLGSGNADKDTLGQLENSGFLIEHGASMIRNLSIARWRGGHSSGHLDSLLEKLIEHFKDQFVDSYDKERASILVLWRGWAVAAPRGVLDLCELALSLPSNPEQLGHDFFTHSPEVEEMIHRKVLSSAFELLAGLIVGLRKDQDEFREKSLELLWLHRDKLRDQSNSVSHDSPYRAFALERNRLEKSWIFALGWLEEKVSSDPNDLWFKQRTRQVRDFLAPALKGFIESTDSHGRSIQFSAQPAPLGFAPQARETALRIVKLVGTQSKMGALNVVGLLREIAWAARSPYGGTVSEEWLSEWEAYRLKAVKILGDILSARPEITVRLRVRQSVMDLLNLRDQSQKFIESCQSCLRQIEETDDLCLHLALVSHDWREFRGKHREEEIIQEWKSICHRGVSHLRFLVESESLPVVCERLGKRLSAEGWSVGWGYVFEILADEPEFIEQLLEYLLEYPDVSYRSSFEYLCFLSGRKDEWMARGMCTGDSELIAQITFALSRDTQEQSLSATEAALRSLCENADEDQISQLIEHGLHSLFRGSETHTLILVSIPWTKVNLDHLKKLEDLVSDYNRPFVFPSETFPLFFGRLPELPEDAIHQLHHLIAEGIRVAPNEAFSFFHQRVVNSNTDDENLLPYDFDGGLTFSSSESLAADRKLAEESLNAIFQNPENEVFQRRFRIAFLKLHSELLVERISTVGASEFGLIVDLIKRSRLFLCLEHPELVRSILQRASSDFSHRLQKCRDAFVRSLHMRGRSYTNGVPDDSHVLETARKLSSKFAGDDLLRDFYGEIIRLEECHVEESKRRHMMELESEDSF